MMGTSSVLVVDDDPLMRQALVAASESVGLEAVAFGDAEQARKAFDQEPYPIVIADWMLPGMTGLELCTSLRKGPDGELPIIMVVTARKDTEALQSVLAAGADDYIAKPVDLEALMVRLEVAQERARVRQERKRAEARLAVTLKQLRQHNADMQAILDRIRIGCVMSDAQGAVAFVSAAARRILGSEHDTDNGLGEAFRSWFPLSSKDMKRLEQMASAQPEQRSKVTAALETAGVRRELEIEVHDDPRHSGAKMYLLYDLTEVHDLRRQLSDQASYHDFIGRSAKMRAVYQLIQDVAPIDATVLVQGDTGTGKELVARALHAASSRTDGPFVAVNCAGLTESLVSSQLFGHVRGAFTGAVSDRRGMFEAANGGTLFLDEIGDIPPTVQTALLRVLQEREIIRIGEHRARKVDVRVVCATHRDLALEVQEGRFRADLLYRIRVAQIALPALKERREDIPLLAPFFLRQFRSSSGKNVTSISDEAMRALTSHHWPGNVRELKSAVEFAAIRCRGQVVRPEDLSTELTEGTPVPATVHESLAWRPQRASPLPHGKAAQDSERDRIIAALRETGGNRKEAANALGMSRATFYRRLTKLGLT